MLTKANTLIGYKLQSLDGEIGKVKDFYFDDQHWTVRYLIADTGDWLTQRQVLISPQALIGITSKKQHIDVNLFKKQIQDSPSLNTDKPVSRQFEVSYYQYYGWPVYWSGPFMWGANPFISREVVPPKASIKDKHWDPHLRSTHSVTGYHIQAADGELGHVDGFIIDDKTWAIRYLIVDTRNWWPGKKVIISPQWIERVSWRESKVFISLSRDIIRQSPEYTEKSRLTRDYEAGLHQHYKRDGYWVHKSSSPKQESRRYQCTFCGEEFLSLIELRAHKKKYKGPHSRPKLGKKKVPDIIEGVENLRDRGYHGYRETDRSS